jgi:hypothetical protein
VGDAPFASPALTFPSPPPRANGSDGWNGLDGGNECDHETVLARAPGLAD